MNGVFTYTGKEFPETSDFFTVYHDGKVGLKEVCSYISSHGCVIKGNVGRAFAKGVEREHGKTVSESFNDFLLKLVEEGFIIEGEKQYRITRKGANLIHSVKTGNSCSSEFFLTLKNLKNLHGRRPLDYAEPVKHFTLLSEVEADIQYIIGNADYYNSVMKDLSELGFVETIIPTNNNNGKHL